MQDEDFEWDDDKASINIRRHKVSFEFACAVFDDPSRIEEPDDDPAEDRWIVTGRALDRLLVVVYTERNGRIRIISARKANRHEQADYTDWDR